MEAVREKKPKPKPRVAPIQTPVAPVAPPRELTPVREAPPLPPRQNTLPEPSAAVSTAVRSRSPSPEPEEIVFNQPTPSVAQPTTSTAPPINYIFPKTASEKTPVPAEAPPQTAVRQSAPPRSAYPSLPRELEYDIPISTMRPPPAYSELLEEARAAARPSIVSAPQAMAPPMYPAASKLLFEKTRHGLLTEEHLLSYYHNPLHERADEMTTRFIQNEELPSGPLFPLLSRLKELCERAVLGEIEEKENSEALTRCLHECWMLNEEPVAFQGRCGDDREAKGYASYQKATLSGAKVADMKRLLSKNRSVLLNQRLNHEVEIRSLVLQIQWKVLAINNQFMGEHTLSLNSPPVLLASNSPAPSWRLMRDAVSALCFHLRFLNLPRRFIDVVTGWLTEICAVFFKKCSSEDAQFILLHLLRLPSPVLEWATPLIQTFSASSAPNKLKVDHSVAMLGHLMSPIRAREAFLRQVGQGEDEDQGWAILSDDDGDDPNFSFVTIDERDLVAFLDQLPAADFYSLAYLQFSAEQAEHGPRFTSLVAFQLLLMKLLNEGLNTYGRPSYKLFCKQIGMYLRQSVRELCHLWQTTKSLLLPPEFEQLQREVDRIMIVAVQYITFHKSLGLYQFLVDLPFEFVSEDCRARLQYLVRSPATLTAKEIYDIPVTELPAKIDKCTLKEKISNPEDPDSVFLINSLAMITSVSTADPTKFIREVFQLCFCDETTAPLLYKVGGEALGQMIGRKPQLLDQLLATMDRMIDHMGSYAVDTLASCDLTSCRVSQAVLGSTIGKWLISRSPDHAANRLARRILASLNWGYGPDGSLWMDTGIHDMCAATVVKAHTAHCGKSNGMIAKSINKISKLVSKIPDYETHFNQFVWDILIKLKLTTQLTTVPCEQDLAAFFVYVTKHAIAKLDILLDKGVPMMNDLVNSGCTVASAVLLGRILLRFYPEANKLWCNESFVEMAERVLHSDQCSYAVQLVAGTSATPTPVVRILRAHILVVSQTIQDLPSFLGAWVKLLAAQKIYYWNSDQVSLQILGTIAQIAFQRDNEQFLGLRKTLFDIYAKLQNTAKEQSKGFLGFLSGEPPPAQLILPASYPVSPWATYLLLLVEQDSFPTYYTYLWEALAKKDKVAVDQACKKAAQKSSIHLGPERIASARWAEAVVLCAESPILPLFVQQLATFLFSRRPSLGKTHVFASRLSNSTISAATFSTCRRKLDILSHPKGFYKAVAGWMGSNKDLNAPNVNFSNFDLDYLLQLILSGDKSAWMDFLDLSTIHQAAQEEMKLYNVVCHEERKGAVQNGWTGPSDRDRVIRAVTFPTIPTHPGLPPAPRLDLQMMDQNVVMSLFQPILRNVNKLSDSFVTIADELETADQKYCELISRLYVGVARSITVMVQCGTRCQRPNQATVQVTATEFSTHCDAEMTQNRERRGTSIASAQASLLDTAATQTASMEFIALQVASSASFMEGLQRNRIQAVGRSLFYLVTSSITNEAMLFPAATASFESVLQVLGQQFVRMRPEEQFQVMRLVLDGFVLSGPLVEAFTPACLSAQELSECYSRLSEKVGNLEQSQSAFKLLQRLEIDQTAATLPAQHFASLIPLAFNNVASQPDPNSDLHKLCLQHLVTFIFHKFPLNFVYGLDTSLGGCSTGSAPTHLFEVIADRLDAEHWEQPKGEFVVNGSMSLECCVVLTRRLAEARVLLGANFFSIWSRYINPVTRLAQLFLNTAVRETFDGSIPESILIKSLVDAFSRIVALFSPLLAPPSPSVPPFSQSHLAEANMCVERMVQHINALPYNACLAPGQQNTQALTWQFFCEKLSKITHGTGPYFSVLETNLMRIHWPSFWPTLRALTAMNEALSSRSPDCFHLVTQVFVRVPWMDVLSQNVPPEIQPQYLATLLYVITRIVAKPANYTKVRASLCEILKQLTPRPEWKTISPEDCEAISRLVSESLPADCLSNSTDVLSVYLPLWRKICLFSVQEKNISNEVLGKQRAFVRSELRLMLRGNEQSVLVHYNNLIADCDAIAKAHRPSDRKPFSTVSRELSTIWTEIPDVKTGETLVNGLTAYLAANPTSPLTLLVPYTIIDSLSIDQLTTALKVMEKAIQAYFKRTDACWADLLEWCMFPAKQIPSIFHYLLTVPNSDNKVQPLLLTLRALLDHGVHADDRFHAVLVYLDRLKPKYVDDEATVLVLLHRVLQWLCPLVARGASTITEPVQLLQRWLSKAKIEEKQGLFSGIITAKRNQYSHKFCTLVAVFELFVQHQAANANHPLRVAPNEPIMNSRIGALRELAGQKQNQPLTSMFNLCTVYFSSSDYTFKDGSQLLDKLMRECYREKYIQE